MRIRTTFNLAFIIIVVFGIFLAVIISLLLSDTITKYLVDIKKDRVIDTVSAEIGALLKRDDFDPQKYAEKQEEFSEFAQKVKTPEIAGINLWSRDGTIIYSAEEYVVGKNFSENPRFQQALSGAIFTSTDPLSDPGFPTQFDDKLKLMEIYAPVKFDDNVVGVVEIYVTPAYLDDYIAKINGVIFFIAASFVIAGVILITIINWSIKRSIITPLEKLRQTADKIAGGDFTLASVESSNEIGIFAKSFNIMIERLEKARHEVVRYERLATIGEISASIAHNLKNPLSIILNRVQLLKMENADLDEKSARHLDIISRAVQKMDFEVEQVLEHVRYVHLSLEEAILKDIIHSSLDRIVIPDTVKITIQSSDTRILCDPVKLEIVFANMITNSIQAMKNVGEIRIRTFEREDDVVIVIEDSGPGIPARALPRIFEPLFTTKMNGTGLGLATCKNIVESHGGHISARNEPTTFTIELPKKIIKNKDG